MLPLFSSNAQQIALENGELSFYSDFLSKADADRYFQTVYDKTAWHQSRLRMAGKERLIPRLNAWYGDPEANYSYSGMQLTLNPWFAELDELRGMLRERLAEDFNSALVNLYRDGNDSVSWHSDDEPELGRNPLIASISLGETRCFQIKPKQGGSKRDLELTHGSLLVMRGATQHYWQHQIPKQKKVLKPRINLTFRQIK